MFYSDLRAVIRTTGELVLLVSGLCIAQPATIAVKDFDCSPAFADIAGLIADRVRAVLVADSAYTVLERENMHEILAEQGFQLTGCVSDQCAAEIGQLLNAHYLITGKIRRVSSSWYLDLSLLDVQKGQIIAKSHYDCTCDAREFAARAAADATLRLFSARKPIYHSDADHSRRDKKRKTVSRVLISAAGLASCAAGYWCDTQVRKQSGAQLSIEQVYAASRDNSLYASYNAQYQQAWDLGNQWVKRRNMLYAAGGAFGGALVFTFFF